MFLKEEVKKQKLEVGKWYKILNNWWGKFESIHNSGNRIKFSETITSNGKYINSPNHVDFISEIKLLEDLSEIQQYLPDDHIDKIKPAKEFEFNRWYKNNTADGLFFIESKNTGYGFRSNYKNYWFERTKDMGGWDLTNLTIAPDSEVKERLLAYTKEHYKKYYKYKCLLHNDICDIRLDDIQFTENLDGLVDSDIGYLYYKGKWAEIFSKPESKIGEYVHCETQEQCDFASRKLGRRDKVSQAVTQKNVPEYVELLKGWSLDDEFVGEIFDTKIDFQTQFKKLKYITKTWDWKFIFTNKNHSKYFQQSTKKAYESQFVFKESIRKFKVGDKICGKSRGGEIIHSERNGCWNPLGKRGKYFIANKIEYYGEFVDIWSGKGFWTCYEKDLWLYEEFSNKDQCLIPQPEISEIKSYPLEPKIIRVNKVKI
jgi:hypothetical protein